MAFLSFLTINDLSEEHTLLGLMGQEMTLGKTNTKHFVWVVWDLRVFHKALLFIDINVCLILDLSV